MVTKQQDVTFIYYTIEQIQYTPVAHFGSCFKTINQTDAWCTAIRMKMSLIACDRHLISAFKNEVRDIVIIAYLSVGRVLVAYRTFKSL